MSEATTRDRILVQRADFSLGEEYERLAARHDTGAIVTFVGKVRDFNQVDQTQEQKAPSKSRVMTINSTSGIMLN